MSYPALLEERDHDLYRAVFDEVRAVDQNYAAAAFASLANFFGTLADGGSYVPGRCRRRLLRIDYEVVDRAQTLPLFQRIDFEFFKIERFGKFLHLTWEKCNRSTLPHRGNPE